MIQHLLTVSEMSEADRLTVAAGTSIRALMERAGRAVADACAPLLVGKAAGPIVVLCGPGNNGGDGFVAARCLAEQRHDVGVWLAGPRERLQGAAAQAAEDWHSQIGAIDEAPIEQARLIVDALFGAGLSRSIEGELAKLVGRVNAAAAPVLAVDVPSGIDGDTGEVRGACIDATATVSFFRAKPGHYLMPGAARRGTLTIADIGIADTVLDAIKPAAALNEPGLWLADVPWPSADGHKYSRGHALVLSGGLSHTGAARMSARAALRVGAGLVTLASPSDALAVNASQLTAVMVRAVDDAAGLATVLGDARNNAVVLGPGLGVGADTRTLVEAALAPQTAIPKSTKPRACVLDADALTSFEGRATELARLIAAASGPTVITPHDGEFARLFSREAEITSVSSKLDRTRAAATKLGCLVLLKGSDTVVADPSGRAAIAEGNAPWLATAGSGDVLSGLVGGLLAQAMPAFEAAAAAVWMHAEAARLFGPGLIAEDLPEMMPRVLAGLWGQAQHR